MARPGKKKKALFIVEIVVLLLFIGGLYVYGQIVSKLDKIDTPTLDTNRVEINPEAPKMTGYRTYALFGIDHRDKNAELGGENSDTIIIASINNDTKDVKLVSVYRDTLMNIGNETYSKANAAYAQGGPEQAISMLNTNLDLNISDYVTINFNALATTIDLLGGLDIPMSYAEIEHMNNYCVETSEETDKSYTPIEKPEPAPEDQEAILGTYHLNGVQATSYCRIRKTASLDMGRTERQRRVIQMIVDKAKNAGLPTIFKIMDEVFPMVKTSIAKDEILTLIPAMIGYSLDDTTGFPQQYKFSNVKGSIIVPTTLETNVLELHRFLYGDTGYTVSEEILYRSDKILEVVGGEENMMDAPMDTADTEENEDDSFIWQEPADNTVDNSGTDTGDGSYTPDNGGVDNVPDNGSGDYNPDEGGGDYTPDEGGGDYTPDDGGGDYIPDEGTDGGGVPDEGTDGGEEDFSDGQNLEDSGISEDAESEGSYEEASPEE